MLKKRKTKNVNRVLSILLAISIVLSPLTDNAFSQAKRPERSYDSKLSDPLKKQMIKKDGKIDLLIKLKREVDEKELKMQIRQAGEEFGTEIGKRKAVIGALKENANDSQQDLLDYLEGKKKEGLVESYDSIFIVNAVRTVADESLVDDIAARDDVELLDINTKLVNEEPEKAKKSKKQRMNQTEYSFDEEEMEEGLKRINVNKVRREYNAKGNGVVVGILDSSVDYQHPALKNQFLGYDAATGKYNFKDAFIDVTTKNKQAPDRADDMEHGSHCVGTMLGEETTGSGDKINNIGVAPEAKWISARVFDNDGKSTTFGFLNAAEWMLEPNGKAENAPVVVNNSWGDSSGSNSLDPWFRPSIKNWIKVGIVPVFAAGNKFAGEIQDPGPYSITNPANIPEVLSVAALAPDNSLAYFSRKGPSKFPDANDFKPEVSAPGVEIRSSVKDGYSYMNGTSMAAPHVSGVVALLKAENKNLSPDQIKQIIKETATPLKDLTYTESPNHGYGYGIVDAYAALSKVKGKNSTTLSGKVKIHGKLVKAHIEVEELNKSVDSDMVTGEFKINLLRGKRTLKVSAPGCKTVERVVDLNKDAVEENFELEAKQKAIVKGKVTDSAGLPVEGVSVRLIEDSNVEPKLTNSTGNYLLEDVYEGSYTMRFYKDGKSLYETDIEVTGSGAHIKDAVLLDIDSDYVTQEMGYDNGRINDGEYNNFPISPRSRAVGVKFIPTKKRSMIKTVSMDIARSYGTKTGTLKLEIYTIDKRGRTKALTEPMILRYTTGEKLKVNLADRKIYTEKPYYVVVSPSSRYSPGFHLGADKTGDSSYSYYFRSKNIADMDLLSARGAAMIQASMLYRKSAGDIDNYVKPPSLEPVSGDVQQISGTAKDAYKVAIKLPGINGSYTRLIPVDDEGRFSFVPENQLRPGNTIEVSARDVDGFSSVSVSTIVRTANSKLKSMIALAEEKVVKIQDEDVVAEIREIIAKAKNLYTESEQINKKQEVTSQEVESMQEEIDRTYLELKNSLNQSNPLKRTLKLAIDKLEKIIKNTKPSYTGKDITSNYFWAEKEDISKAQTKLEAAKGAYEKDGISDPQLEAVTAETTAATVEFEKVRKKGLKAPIVIDDRYADGIYQGRGKGAYFVENSIEIEIKKGKLISVKIIDWNDTAASKRLIEEGGFLEKIVKENSVDIELLKGAVEASRSVIEAVEGALNKAAVTRLGELISEAEKLKSGIVVSTDGTDTNNMKWVLKSEYSAFGEVIDRVKMKYSEQQPKPEEVLQARSELMTAMEAFRSLIKEPINKPKTWNMGTYIFHASASGKLRLPKGEDAKNLRWSAADKSMVNIRGEGKLYFRLPGITTVRAEYKNRIYVYTLKIRPAAVVSYRGKIRKRYVTLSWRPSKGMDGVFVYRAVKKNGKYIFKLLHVEKNPKKTSLKFYVPRGSVYGYKVKAYKYIGGYRYLSKPTKNLYFRSR